MSNEWIGDVLTFWFTELKPEDWFRKDAALDAKIAARFGDLHTRLSHDVPAHVEESPEGVLAAVIVLDQFSRNLFRDSPRAFATDAIALNLSKRAVAAGLDKLLSPQRRVFLYMPFEHSEDKSDQAQSLQLFTTLGLAEFIPYAEGHKKIIDRFGRFPHRNAVLGRTSTAEEAEFIATNPGY